MTTGHERPRWRQYASVCWSLFNLMGLVIWITLACMAWQQNRELRDDWRNVVTSNGRLLEANSELQQRLDWWECRNVTPEQPGSPTPIEDDHPSIEQELSAAMSVVAGVYGSPVQDLRAEYASQYRKAHHEKVAEVGHCEGCGKSQAVVEAEGGHLETHHEISLKRIFDEGLDHSLIYDPANFCVFCRDCHHRFGHPHGWGDSNPNVRRDAARNLRKTTQAL